MAVSDLSLCFLDGDFERGDPFTTTGDRLPVEGAFDGSWPSFNGRPGLFFADLVLLFPCRCRLVGGLSRASTARFGPRCLETLGEVTGDGVGVASLDEDDDTL